MRFDSWGLGYTWRERILYVHYPHRAADGSTEYGAGFAFDPRPEIDRDPTSVRALLWSDMMHPKSTYRE